MSTEQFEQLLAKIKVDEELAHQLKNTGSLDSFLKIVNEAGFNLTKADWLRYQAQKIIELDDDELERVAGGNGGNWPKPSDKDCTGTQVICLYCD